MVPSRASIAGTGNPRWPTTCDVPGTIFRVRNFFLPKMSSVAPVLNIASPARRWCRAIPVAIAVASWRSAPGGRPWPVPTPMGRDGASSFRPADVLKVVLDHRHPSETGKQTLRSLSRRGVGGVIGFREWISRFHFRLETGRDHPVGNASFSGRVLYSGRRRKLVSSRSIQPTCPTPSPKGFDLTRTRISSSW